MAGALQIFRLQSGMLCDPGQHFRTNLFATMKSPCKSGKSIAKKLEVRPVADSLVFRPTDAFERLQNLSGLGAWPVTHAAAN